MLLYKTQGRKDTGTKPLLVVFHATAIDFSVFYNSLPWIRIPEGKFSNRNNIHVGTNPDAVVIKITWNCCNKIWSHARRHAAVRSIKMVKIFYSVCNKPLLKSGTLLAFPVPAVFRSKGWYGCNCPFKVYCHFSIFIDKVFELIEFFVVHDSIIESKII